MSRKRVVVFGAAGPVAAHSIEALEGHHELLLTDVVDIDTPHEFRRVDIADYSAVVEAMTGQDVAINCTVIRQEMSGAFRVTVAGAYNVARAAVACGVHRIVHTGPLMGSLPRASMMSEGYRLTEDAPAHPGTNLYPLTKYLSEQLTEVFAEQEGLSVIHFRMCAYAGDGYGHAGPGMHPFVIHWDDLAQAFRRAVEVDDLERPFECFNLCCSTPHDKYPNDKLKCVLGFETVHDLEEFWTWPEDRAGN